MTESPSHPVTQSKIAGVALLVAAAVLYFATLDTGLLPRELQGGDLITHQYAQVQARPSNAPGYPLYTMGGWLWFHSWHTVLGWIGNAMPNPIPILSSYSLVWALAALGFLYAILLRLSRSTRWPAGHWPLAFAISVFFAVTYFFWYYATTTEQYSSGVAQTLAIVYFYLRWREDLPTNPCRADRLLLLLAFLCGISLAHLVTVAMIVPPLVIVVLWTQPSLLRRPRMVLGAVTAAALPLLGYIYVYVRGTAHPQWWGAGTWASGNEWFWSFLLTAQGQDELSWGLEPGAPFFGNGFPELIWQELSAPILVVGLIGIALFGRRQTNRQPDPIDARLTFLLYGTLLLYLVLCWVARFGNWFQVILPAYPLILLGLLPVGEWIERRAALVRPGLAVLPLLLLTVAVAWRVDASLPAADSSRRPEDTALIRPALLLDQTLPPGAALFAETDDALGLRYLIDIWGIRSDLQVVSSPQADALLAAGEPVFAASTASALLRSELVLSAPVTVHAQTPDWVMLRSGDPQPDGPPAVTLDRTLGDSIVLAGYSLTHGPDGAPVLHETAPTVDLRLFWRIIEDDGQQTTDDWAISVRPLREGVLVVGADGGPIQRDSVGPVQGLRPFGEIVPGVLVADGYRLPAETPFDGVQVVLYRATEGGFENLAAVEFDVESELEK
ncbi:DUF2723 domain-containing protein [bacterium]|nr:DUF2723 domain-containing protein [bacterium]